MVLEIVTKRSTSRQSLYPPVPLVLVYLLLVSSTTASQAQSLQVVPQGANVWPRQNSVDSTSSQSTVLPSSTLISNFAIAAPTSTSTSSLSNSVVSSLFSSTQGLSVSSPPTFTDLQSSTTSTTSTTSTAFAGQSTNSGPSSSRTRSSSSPSSRLAPPPSPTSSGTALIPVTTLIIEQTGLLSTIRIAPTQASSLVSPSRTPVPEGTINPIDATSDSFWENKGAVAGIFTAGGLAVLALMVTVGIYIRRHYAKREPDDSFFQTYHDGGSSSHYIGSSPGPSMGEITAPAPVGSYPERDVYVASSQHAAQGLYSDYPPGTQYPSYADAPDIAYGTAITHDGVYQQSSNTEPGNVFQAYDGYAPTMTTAASSSSAYSVSHPYARPVITSANLFPPSSAGARRPLSYDSFYTSQHQSQV